MERHAESRDGSIGASLKATYRALLARGLETGEAANLTAFLHGLPSDDFHWTLPEIEGVIQRRIQHAAELRAAERAAERATARRAAAGRDHAPGATRPTIHDRRVTRAGSTHVIDPPRP